MVAVIEEAIYRDGQNLWVAPGRYEILRRFDSNRWLIVLQRDPKTVSKNRQLTLVRNDEMFLGSDEGEMPL